MAKVTLAQIRQTAKMTLSDSKPHNAPATARPAACGRAILLNVAGRTLILEVQNG